MPVSASRISLSHRMPAARPPQAAAEPPTRPSAACLVYAAVFHDPLLETPPSGGDAAGRRRYAALIDQAEAVCRTCPLLAGCLYRAVVEHDVAGYAGGTTERQRGEIRRRLGVRVEPEDFDTLAGVTGRHRPVDHDEVVRLRNANPHESLETLARRLGCSLSTVKRHLRRERNAPSVRQARRPRPSAAQVAAVAVEVTRPPARRAVAA